MILPVPLGKRRESEFEVVIVGAGPSGLGCAVALKACGIERLLVIDRDGIGSSFERWPAQMRMITPSFHSNPYNQPDLNSITPHTSPADFLGTEHPSGPEYARYLRAVAHHYEIPVRDGIAIDEVVKKGKIFRLRHSEGEFRSRFVIWATGEFGNPDDGGIAGADLCLHNSRVLDWSLLPGEEHAVIGGFESGCDAAIHLARAGKKVRLFSRGEPWNGRDTDPSCSLSPFTRDRLRSVLEEGRGSIEFQPGVEIIDVREKDGGYVMTEVSGKEFPVSTPPILATGFLGGLGPVRAHFSDENGALSFTEEADESPLLSGLFYSGPNLRHRGSLFCFIYKFRARFGVVAGEIADRLGIRWEEPLRPWWERGFLIEDVGCCVDCSCAVSAEEKGSSAADSSTAPVADMVSR